MDDIYVVRMVFKTGRSYCMAAFHTRELAAAYARHVTKDDARVYKERPDDAPRYEVEQVSVYDFDFEEVNRKAVVKGV